MDELAVFTAGNNLAQHGRADINQLIWTNHWTPNPPGIWGQDGNLYTKKAPGISFITAPLIWLGHNLPDLNAVHVGLLTNTLITAITASLLFVWLTDLGFARLPAALTTLGYGLCTIAWIYARMFWESSLLALSFLIAVWAIYRSTRLAYARQRLRWIFISGLAIAVGFTLRFETIPAIGFIGLYIIWESISWQISQLTGQTWSPSTPGISRETSYHALIPIQAFPALLRAIPWGRLVIYLTPVVLTTAGLLYFNFVRYGSFGETGYSQELLFQAPWIGSFGLLFSPGRGLFIYAPVMLLLFFGLRPARRRLSSSYFWLIVVLCLFYWLFYGSWFAWGGTWGWGPRFLLPILPLLMLFVAEPIERVFLKTQDLRDRGSRPTPHALRETHFWSISLAWLGIILLTTLSLIINFLGVTVDFNEHFLRLGRNDNFVFNWATFPPLAHWQIFQEGLIDLIWVRDGFTVEWAILTPALILCGLAAIGLGITLAHEFSAYKKNSRINHHRSTASGLYVAFGVRYFLPRTTLYILLFILLPLSLTYHTMLGTAQIALEDQQLQADKPVLDLLASAAQPNDSLLIPMPPFGDVQEVSTAMIAYLDQSIPTAAWIESEPRAIQPTERVQISKAISAEADRVWLFERWLSPTGPTTQTAAHFNEQAFPMAEHWFEQSGKVTLYAVAHQPQAVEPDTLNVPFQGGLSLLDFSLFDRRLTSQEVIIRLRLTWQAAASDILAREGIPPDRVIASIQLLAEDASRSITQNDRLLFDLQSFDQSPLLPGQTIQQGYGLQLSEVLAPGSYPLVVSLYRASNGQRLKRADGSPDDFLYLTNVVVE